MSLRSSLSTQQQQQAADSSQQELYQELKWISKEIQRMDQAYYNNNNNTEADDATFDALVAREEYFQQSHPSLVAQWQKESGLGMAATRTGRVGAATAVSVRPSHRREHLQPMLSLDNAYNWDEFYAWIKRISTKILLAQKDNNNDKTTTSIQIVTEPKLDGVSLSLRYEPSSGSNKSSLKWAATRGDGQAGMDVTETIRQGMRHCIPLELNATASKSDNVIEIRGEVVVPRSVFASTSVPDTFSNARNAASGWLLRKESDAASRALQGTLQFYAYDVVGWDIDQSLLNVRQQLQDWGFAIPQPMVLSNVTLSTDAEQIIMLDQQPGLAPMREYYEALQEHREGLVAADATKKSLPVVDVDGEESTQSKASVIKSTTRKKTKFDWGDYDMDGCVHKVLDGTYRQWLGASAKVPRWAIAHKFPPTTVVTRLLDVETQVGRTGALTPVAVLEAVDYHGICIQRATLHNFVRMQSLLLGEDNKNATRIPKGSLVVVRRAGDVIPQVLSCVYQANAADDWIDLSVPSRCPACQSPTITDDLVVRCGGPALQCPPRAATALQHAMSRPALNVAGLSTAKIRQLQNVSWTDNRNLLTYPSDLFLWGQEEWEQVQALEGWGPKSVQNLQDIVEAIRRDGVPLHRFLIALNIRFAGEQSCKLLATAFGTVDNFLESLDQVAAKEEDALDFLNETKGIGPALISSLRDFALEKTSLEQAKVLARCFPVHEEKVMNQANQDLPWYNQSIVFSGSLPNGISRKQAQTWAKEVLGAKATPSALTKSTTLLVIGDKGTGKKKLAQADEWGIPVLTADNFLDLVRQHQPKETEPK